MHRYKERVRTLDLLSVRIKDLQIEDHIYMVELDMMYDWRNLVEVGARCASQNGGYIIDYDIDKYIQSIKNALKLDRLDIQFKPVVEGHILIVKFKYSINLTIKKLFEVFESIPYTITIQDCDPNP